MLVQHELKTFKGNKPLIPILGSQGLQSPNKDVNLNKPMSIT